jgi:hypothetical protein
MGTMLAPTDAGVGIQFSFDPGFFILLCSDLSKFSVARAVTVSSAVPVLFGVAPTPGLLRDAAK